MNEWDPTHEGRRHKPREVTDDTAAERVETVDNLRQIALLRLEGMV